MRLHLLQSLIFLCPTLVFAQSTQLPTWNSPPHADIQTQQTAANVLNLNSSDQEETGSPELAGDTLLYEDFDWGGNTLPTGWTKSILFGPGPGFVWSNTGPSGNFSSSAEKIQSTTGNNGFLLLNADSANSPVQLGNITANITTAAIPNLTNVPAMHIQLEVAFRWNTTFGTTGMELQVSDNDFINFPTPGNLGTFDLRNNVGINVASDNPMILDKMLVDLSNVTNINNVKLRILWENGTYYHFQVDDILVTEAPANDITISNVLYNGVNDLSKYELYYTQIPLRQFRADTMQLGAEFVNSGYTQQSGVEVDVAVLGPGVMYSGISGQSGLAVGGFGVLADTVQFTPGAGADIGTYNFNYSVGTFSSIDFDPTDNDLTGFPVEATGSSYARDAGSPGFLRQRTPVGLVGNLYEINVDDTATAITYYIGNTTQGSSVGSVIRCHLVLLPSYTLLGSSDSITITTGNVGNYNTVQFDTNIALSAGDRVIAVLEVMSGLPWIGIDPDRVPRPGTVYENFGSVNGQGGFWITNFFNATPHIRLRTKPISDLCDSANIAVIGGGDVFFNGNFTSAFISPVTVTGTNPPFSYSWSNGANTTGLVNLTTTDTYMLTVTDNLGCSKVFDYFVNFDCANANMSIDNGTGVVTYDEFNFVGEITDVSISNGTGPYSYEWNTGATTTGIDNLTSSGTYTLTVTDDATCKRNFDFEILLCPDKTMTIAPGSGNITYDRDNFTADISFIFIFGGVPPLSYQWSSDPDDTLSSVQGLDRASIYTVTVTDSDGCTKTFNFDINNDDTGSGPGNVGLEDELEAESFSFALDPNPNNGQFRLSIDASARNHNLQAEVMDLLGKQVYQDQFSIDGKSTLQMDLGQLQKGLYFIKLSEGTQEVTRRLIVH